MKGRLAWFLLSVCLILGSSANTVSVRDGIVVRPAEITSVYHRPMPPSVMPVVRAVKPSIRTRSGTASWGYFGGHVVTRLPRGTRIEIVGPRGTWRGESWGYGPAAYTGRIVDLDASVFSRICGPLSVGLCQVTLRW